MTCHDIISSLSFNNYVLVNCLKFNQSKKTGIYGCLYNLEFIALTEQGLLNIYTELTIKDICKCDVMFFNDHIKISKPNLVFILRYTTDNIEDLIKLPGLDFYKCYYDGIKIHCTPEAIQCHKTGKVKYVEKLNRKMPSDDITYSCLKFDPMFWKNNDVNVKEIYKLDFVFVRDKIYYRHKIVSLYDCIEKEQYIKIVHDFIQENIFKNPTHSLC
jgi:hypothetical protein